MILLKLNRGMPQNRNSRQDLNKVLRTERTSKATAKTFNSVICTLISSKTNQQRKITERICTLKEEIVQMSMKSEV